MEIISLPFLPFSGAVACWPIYLSSFCLLNVHLEISSLSFPLSPVQQLICLSSFPVFVYWKFTRRSAPCPSPLLRCTQTTPAPLLCVPFQFLVYYSVFFFLFEEQGQSVKGAMLVYPRGSCGNTRCHLFAHLFCISQAVLEPVSDSVGSFCFLSVMWCGEALYGLGVQGVRVLILPGVFFLASVVPASQQGFWYMELTLSASAL
jgi:hypothetical protein